MCLLRSRGFGFITFEDASSVESVMRDKNHTIDGKFVECKRATPRDQMGGRGGGGGRGGDRRGGDRNGGSNERVKKVFVGGLKEDVTENVS